MDSHSDETSHVIILGSFENNKKYKERIVNEIKIVICAMLNSSGGKVVIDIDTESIEIPVEASPFSKTSLLIRILEQYMTSIIGTHLTVSRINFKEEENTIVIMVGKGDFFVTINYNLYLPSQTQVVQIPPTEPLENIKNVISRRVIMEPVRLGSHQNLLFKDKNSGLKDNKIIQLKNVKAGASKRTTLADRMTGKGNKFSCYVSAFANHRGGHIYFGIKDDGVVEGEFIPNEKGKEEIVKKVEKAINKMIWPEQIGWPKRREHWEIFFEPVVDADSKPVPSTFVIVIYIAPCLGGVFTEEPESYEMVEGQVRKMSFHAWKYRMSQPVWIHYTHVLPSLERIRWSSPEVRKNFIVGDEKLMQLINEGDWEAASKEGDILQSQSEFLEMKLLVLSKQITACYRRGRCNEARSFLTKYKNDLHEAKDVLIFEVVGLYLEAALKRACGDLEGLEQVLTQALQKAELIEPGLVTAIVYILAGTVADRLSLEGTKEKLSPDVLSKMALEHLRHVPDSSEVLADMKQKAHITLATFYLGCNIRGRTFKEKIDIPDIDRAKTSIMTVHESADEGHQLSAYREVQLKLVLSIYNFRLSQVMPDEKTRFLRCAFNYAKKAERLAKEHEFTEMLEWGKANKSLCTKSNSEKT